METPELINCRAKSGFKLPWINARDAEAAARIVKGK